MGTITTDEEAQMWSAYKYKGYRVRVTQKWQDPFGKRMIRIEALDDSDIAQGLAETEFMAEADPLPDTARIND